MKIQGRIMLTNHSACVNVLEIGNNFGGKAAYMVNRINTFGFKT